MGKKSRKWSNRMHDRGVREMPTNYRRIDGEPHGNLTTGWETDNDCLNYCRQQFPDLPDAMIELAMDYCKKHKNVEAKWKNRPSINQKELTGKQRRQMKRDGTLQEYLDKKNAYLNNFEPMINGAVKIYGPGEEYPKWDKYVKGQVGTGRDEKVQENPKDLHQFTLLGKIYNNRMDTYEAALEKYNKMVEDGLNPEDGRKKENEKITSNEDI